MVEYRPASKKELRAIWARNRADHPRDSRWERWEEEYVRYNDEGGAITVGAFGPEPVGEVTLLLSPETAAVGGRLDLADARGRCNINALRVFEPYRGNRHATRLVECAENLAKSLGFGAVTIGAEMKEERNIAIYRHFGYRERLFVALEGADEADFDPKFREFLKIAALLGGEFEVSPLLYGSLGLSFQCGEDFGADDIDILVPKRLVREDWPLFRAVLERNGYVLLDEREHEFQKDGITCAFAELEELRDFAGIEMRDITDYELGGRRFKMLSPEQYLRVYSASVKDGYRINTRGKKDKEKIEFLRSLIANEGENAVYPKAFPGDIVVYFKKDL